MIRLFVFIAIALLAARVCVAVPPTTAPAAISIIQVDRNLPNYQRVPALTGTIRSFGSPTTGALISAWADEFKTIYPDVEIEMKGSISTDVMPALVAKNPPNIGAMSRAMTDAEIASFKQHFGYPPTTIRVAVNALGVFVNADNPCQGLTISQLAAIYARPGPDRKQIITWGETGLRDDSWANERILPYALVEMRGETGFFKSRVLADGEFRFDAQIELTSSAVVEDCAVDRGAIGYTSMVFRTRRAKALAIQGADGKFYEPTYDNCISQHYPMTDFLYIYVNKPPNRPLDRPTREFLTFACCQLGQEIAAREGAYPLTPQLAREQLDAIGK
ncbi:MAG TPA: substrate-binding domain-containing protein [Tepidisphaeraceae bacterium]|jgi:phosphate transport system substrate-binding protein|nr:substrate-binding domain-containing protein [Tepidisphaeraceae bacterium]